MEGKDMLGTKLEPGNWVAYGVRDGNLEDHYAEWLKKVNK